jgi:putative thiazole-containing bacteriocin maturation protein
MRPTLQGDTFFLPTTDGIYLRNSQKTLILKGQEIYQWFATLEPYLKGQHTLEAILEDLEPGQRETVRKIVETLLEHGFVQDRSHDLPHTLNQNELSTYAAEIAFIDSFHGSAAATFERFRAQRALLIGSGMAFLALVQATLQAGIRATTIWVTDECETYPQRLQVYREQSQQRDLAQVLVEQSPPDWRDERALRNALAPYDVIFHLSDRLMLQRAMTLNRLCFALHKPFFPALILDDQALIGPVVGVGAPGCWECAWRRWLAAGGTPERHVSHDPCQDNITTTVNPLLGLPTAATVAHVLSFECFKYLTAAGSCEVNGKVVQFDLDTLRCDGHPFLPHPLCGTCQHPVPLDALAFLDKVRLLETQEPLEEAVFSHRVVTCFDPTLGIFTYLGEDDFLQMPLNVSRLTVSAPMSPHHAQETVTLTRAHLTLDTTRRRLTLEGAAHYAARLVDLRRLPTGPGAQEALAYDLHAKRVRRILAVKAYPALDPQRPPPYLLGVGAGLSWAEACAHALLDHCLALTLHEVEQGVVCCRELDVNMQSLDNRTKHLHTLVEQTGRQLRAHHITGSLEVPVLAFSVDDETIVYTAHFDMAQALDDGLERVVQRFQSLEDEQPGYALPSVVQLSTAGCGALESPPHGPVLRGWREGLEWLVERLYQEQWIIAAVPLDHDPALSDVLPFLVRIVLTRDEA